MKKMTAMFVFLFAFLMTGCSGITTLTTAKDPATYRSSQDVTTPGKSRIIEQHCESEIVGGCDGYGEGSSEGHAHHGPHGTLHPVTILARPQYYMTPAQQSREDMAGGVRVLHPGALDGVNRRIEELQADQDTLTLVIASDHEKVKKIEKKSNKKDGKKDNKKSPPPAKETEEGTPDDDS